MLALIRTLGPVVALVIGLAGGGTIIGGLAYVYNVLIDNPGIAREATARANDACTIRTQEAAHKAEIAERARQEAVTRDAVKAYQDAIAARDRLASQLQDQLEQGIADNEKRLMDEGRSCTLDDADVQWLKGN